MSGFPRLRHLLALAVLASCRIDFERHVLPPGGGPVDSGAPDTAGPDAPPPVDSGTPPTDTGPTPTDTHIPPQDAPPAECPRPYALVPVQRLDLSPPQGYLARFPLRAGTPRCADLPLDFAPYGALRHQDGYLVVSGSGRTRLVRVLDEGGRTLAEHPIDDTSAVPRKVLSLSVEFRRSVAVELMSGAYVRQYLVLREPMAAAAFWTNPSGSLVTHAASSPELANQLYGVDGVNGRFFDLVPAGGNTFSRNVLYTLEGYAIEALTGALGVATVQLAAYESSRQQSSLGVRNVRTAGGASPPFRLRPVPSCPGAPCLHVEALAIDPSDSNESFVVCSAMDGRRRVIATGRVPCMVFDPPAMHRPNDVTLAP